MKTTLCIIAIALLYTSCGGFPSRRTHAPKGTRRLIERSGERPPWADRKIEDAFDTYEYFRGISTEVEKFDEALNEARKQAIGRIVEYFGTESAFTYTTERNEGTRKIHYKLTLEGSGVVIGAEESDSYWEMWEEVVSVDEVRTWRDAYVRIRVPKQNLREELERRRKQAVELVLGSKRVLDEAVAAAGTGFLTESVSGFSVVIDNLKDTEYLEVGGEKSERVLQEARAAIERIAASVETEKRGDNQSVALGQALPEPLQVVVSYRWAGETVPAVGIELKFTTSQEKGRFDRQAHTDENGIASVMVTDVSGRGTIIASVVLPLNLGVGDAPRETFTFAATNTVLVNVAETVLEEPVEQSTIAVNLLAALQEAGYDVIAPDRLVGESQWTAIMNGNRAAVNEILDTGASMAVVGTAEAVFSQDNYGMISVIAEALIRAVRLSDAKILADTQVRDVKGFGTDKEKAADEALEKLAEQVTEQIIGQLTKEP